MKPKKRVHDCQIINVLYLICMNITMESRVPMSDFAKIEKRQNRLRVYFHVKTNEQALEYKIILLFSSGCYEWDLS